MEEGWSRFARAQAHPGPDTRRAQQSRAGTSVFTGWSNARQRESDGTVKLWEVARGTPRETVSVSSRISGLVWSPNGRYLASGELDRSFWVWDVDQHKQRTTFYGRMAPVRTLAFSPDSRTLDTAYEDGGMQVLDMTTGQCIRSWQAFARSVSDVTWSPNSAQIASGGNDGLVTIWDVAQHVPLHLLRGH